MKNRHNPYVKPSVKVIDVQGADICCASIQDESEGAMISRLLRLRLDIPGNKIKKKIESQ